MFLGGFTLPLTIIIFVYTLIWLELKSIRNSVLNRFVRDDKLIKSDKSNINRNTNDLENIETIKNKQKANLLGNSKQIDSYSSVVNYINDNNQSLLKPFIKREIQVLKTILLIVIMFCCAWLPYAFLTLCAQFVDMKYLVQILTPKTAFLASIFAKTSSIYNPILYTFMNKQFKTYLKKRVIKLNRNDKANINNFNSTSLRKIDIYYS
jgi:hypothetical protein